MKIFDLHCDTATELFLRGLPFENRETQLRAEVLPEGTELIQCFAVFYNDVRPGRRDLAYTEQIVRAVFPQLTRPGLTPILTVEGAGVLAEDREDWPERLCALGCRMAGLVWNGENRLACGAASDDRKGLTVQGREAVLRMISCSVVPDVSHLSAAGTEDLLALTEAPIAASHSNARGVCPHPRNLTDAAAKEIFFRGGVVGLNLYPPFLGEDPGIDDVLRHAEYFFSLGGENGVCLGCDFDGVDRLPRGIRDGSSLPLLYNAAVRAFGVSLADRIFYQNAARFFGTEGV